MSWIFGSVGEFKRQIKTTAKKFRLLSFFSAYISEQTKSISGRVLSPTQALSRTDNKSVNWTLSTQITFTFPQKGKVWHFGKKKLNLSSAQLLSLSSIAPEPLHAELEALLQVQVSSLHHKSGSPSHLPTSSGVKMGSPSHLLTLMTASPELLKQRHLLPGERRSTLPFLAMASLHLLLLLLHVLHLFQLDLDQDQDHRFLSSISL